MRQKKRGTRTYSVWRCSVCGMVHTIRHTKPYIAYCKSTSCRQKRYLFVPWAPRVKEAPLHAQTTHETPCLGAQRGPLPVGDREGHDHHQTRYARRRAPCSLRAS